MIVKVTHWAFKVNAGVLVSNVVIDFYITIATTVLCSEAENIMVDVSADGLCRIFTIAMGTRTINMFRESG